MGVTYSAAVSINVLHKGDVDSKNRPGFHSDKQLTSASLQSPPWADWRMRLVLAIQFFSSCSPHLYVVVDAAENPSFPLSWFRRKQVTKVFNHKENLLLTFRIWWSSSEIGLPLIYLFKSEGSCAILSSINGLGEEDLLNVHRDLRIQPSGFYQLGGGGGD